MAKEEQNDVTGQQEQENEEKPSRAGTMLWIIMVIVIIICAGAGFGLGRIFASFGTNQAAEENLSAQQAAAPAGAPDLGGNGDSQKTWYYDLDPVVGFLDEPGATRYIRAALTMKISTEADPKKTIVYLEEKKPVLTNWLNIYLASLSIDDIRGNRNQKRIQSEILDAFNEKLFPDGKPYIKEILFKEFVPQ